MACGSAPPSLSPSARGRSFHSRSEPRIVGRRAVPLLARSEPAFAHEVREPAGGLFEHGREGRLAAEKV